MVLLGIFELGGIWYAPSFGDPVLSKICVGMGYVSCRADTLYNVHDIIHRRINFVFFNLASIYYNSLTLTMT